MQAKVLEIRDEGTLIPVLAVDINPDTPTSDDDTLVQVKNASQRYLMRRCGYPCDGRPNIVITQLSANGKPASNDPYSWGGRTYPVAHQYIIDHWHELVDGMVVDVEFILGETEAPKISERYTADNRGL